jgi:MFS family permease
MVEKRAAVAVARTLPAVRSRPVALLLGAELFASVARAVTATALGWQAYARTHDPFSLGLIGLAEFLPAALLALPAGQAADRHDRRVVALVGESIAAATAVGLALDAAAGDDRAWPLYALALLGGVGIGIAQPAFNPLLAAAVPAAGLQRVIALSSVTWQAAGIAGPALGGALQAIGNPEPFVVAAAAGGLAGTLAMLTPKAIGTAHVTGEREPPTLREALAGLRLIRDSPALAGAISLDLVAVLFGGATALLPVFARDVLHVGAFGNGLLRAASGAGAVLVGVVLAARPIRRHVGPTLFAAVAVFGAATIVFGLSTSFALSLVALAVLAGADMISVLIRGTLVPLLTPPELRGRVGAVERVFIGASNELGAFESGVAAALLGAVPAVVLGGAASIAAAALWAWWFPSLRRVDRFESAQVSR